MMRTKLPLIFFFSFIFQNTIHAQKISDSKSKQKIIIEGEVPPDYKQKDITLPGFSLFQIDNPEVIGQSFKDSFSITKPVVNGTVKWTLNQTMPMRVWNPLAKFPNRFVYIIEPGDSIFVRQTGKMATFSGKGSAKWSLVQQLENIHDSLQNTELYKDLSGEYRPLKSINDYFNWIKWLNLNEEHCLALIEKYRRQISSTAYYVIKEAVLFYFEEKKTLRFNYLMAGKVKPGQNVNEYGLTNTDLCAIYDSTICSPAARWLQFESPFVGDPYYLYHILFFDSYREKGKFFNLNPADPPILGGKVASYVTRYNLAKKKYKGLIREEVLAYFFHFTRGTLYKVGFEPEIEAILADYYAQSKYPEYAAVVKNHELYYREKLIGKNDLGFTLTDKEGNTFPKDKLKGKIAIFDFWFTGCLGCETMVSALQKVEDAFKGDSSVIFINVSIDKNRDKWIKSLIQKKYTTGNSVPLYTGGEGANHAMIKNYGINGYPTLLVFNPYGFSLRAYPAADPRLDDGKKLIALIREQLIWMKDGPYIIDSGNTSMAYSLDGKTLSIKNIDRLAPAPLTVQTDTSSTFTVTLKPSLSVEPSEYERPEKLFVLSDLEGNFKAFRKLLQNNGIIDSNYNWTFGKGHLVFAGDMFDRGIQVTECLWLVYSLEEKAKRAGGYVHFILGNHEIMNLQGDHKYAVIKYAESASLLGKTMAQLYNENSELGKWLRTKNIVEKIGDLLFTHGGISSRINSMDITIPQINEMARPFYDIDRDDRYNSKLKLIMSDSYGPFWYRGYYSGADATLLLKVIDSTLEKFAVNHIITGHTIVADTISVHHNEKVINTDTNHANGKSEALLIDGEHFYRVNASGNRVLLLGPGQRKRDFLSGIFPVK